MGMRCERELYKCYQLQDAFGALALYLGQKRPYGSFSSSHESAPILLDFLKIII